MIKFDVRDENAIRADVTEEPTPLLSSWCNRNFDNVPRGVLIGRKGRRLTSKSFLAERKVEAFRHKDEK